MDVAALDSVSTADLSGAMSIFETDYSTMTPSQLLRQTEYRIFDDWTPAEKDTRWTT
jgi:hypothetical protein